MTNKPEFNLDAELEETDDWDSSEEAEFQSGYADEPDPEDEPTAGAMELAERHSLRRVAGLSTELHVLLRRVSVLGRLDDRLGTRPRR